MTTETPNTETMAAKDVRRFYARSSGFDLFNIYNSNALKDCIDAGYRALFLPELVDKRINSPFSANAWQQKWYWTLSLRATGKTAGGAKVVVIAHVPHYFSDPKNLREAERQYLVHKYPRGIPDGVMIKHGYLGGMIPDEEFSRLVKLAESGQNGIFVHDAGIWEKSPCGEIPLDEAIGNIKVVSFLGGEKSATQYLPKLQEFLIKEKEKEGLQRFLINEKVINVADRGYSRDRPFGSLLFLGGSFVGFIFTEIGWGLADNSGYFAGVPDEKAQARTVPKKSLLQRIWMSLCDE